MELSFTQCLAFTGREEGGFSTDARDPGCYVSGRVGDGPLIGSNFGISAGLLAKYLAPDAEATFEAMRDISAIAVNAIYRTEFWRPMSCSYLSPGLDLCVMDFGFNAGKIQSGRLLQKTIGMNGQARDGDIGPDTRATIAKTLGRALLYKIAAPEVQTLQAALGLHVDGDVGPNTQAAIAQHANAATLLLISALSTAQRAYYESLPGFATFGAGWLARTVRRQSASLALAIHDATMIDA